MRAQRIKREGAEEIYLTFKNGEAAQLVPGVPVCVDFTTDKNGKVVRFATGTTAFFPAGVVVKTIGTSGNHDQYGEVQVYGYCSTLKVMAGSTINAGDPLVVTSGSSSAGNFAAVTTIYLTQAEVAALQARCIAIAGTTIAAATTGNNDIPCFIRAL